MLELKVRSKTFRIDLVSMYVLEKYDEVTAKSIPLVEAQVKQNILNEDVIEHLEALKKLAKNPGDDGDKKLEDIRKNLDVTRKAISECEKSIRDMSKEIVDLRKEIVKEILESNDFEYDDIFWHRRTAPEDMNEFLLCCVNKDREPDKKKSSVKKKLISSSEESG